MPISPSGLFDLVKELATIAADREDTAAKQRGKSHDDECKDEKRTTGNDGGDLRAVLE